METRPLYPAEFDVVKPEVEAAWYWKLLASDAALSVFSYLASAALTGVMAFLTARHWKNAASEKAVKFISAAVLNTYVTYVREAKARSEDKKLTEDDRLAAMQMAKDCAISMAREEGFDLLKAVGREYLPVLIEWAIGRLKGRNAPLE
jgi:hypothetical protein